MLNLIATSFQSLFVFREVKPNWLHVFIAAFAVSLPAAIGVSLGILPVTILACLGGLVALYAPVGHPYFRLKTIAFVSLGFSISFVLGLLASANIYLSVATLTLNVFFASFFCAYFRLPPPGNFFFIFVACIAHSMPFELTQFSYRVSTLVLGCSLSLVSIAVFDFIRFSATHEKTEKARIAYSKEELIAFVYEAIVLSLFVSGGYLVALSLTSSCLYWLPASCAAIMQGRSITDISARYLHRVLGTFIGFFLAWWIFSSSLEPWHYALLIFVLTFLITAIMPHHYGFAVVFITPVTITIADVSTEFVLTEQLIQDRLLDTVLGAILGLIGGIAMHRHRLRQWTCRQLLMLF